MATCQCEGQPTEKQVKHVRPICLRMADTHHGAVSIQSEKLYIYSGINSKKMDNYHIFGSRLTVYSIDPI